VRPATYKRYLLGILLVILAFNYSDRIALGLVLQDVKSDLHLSDTQLGFLTGISFALFYAVMGLPIARWADRGNRVTIISLTTLLWSVLVALCGSVTSFAQLLLIRIGVGVGEAGCIPPAHSLLADYFARADRPRAMSIYMQGGQISLVGSYFIAGWLNQICGWRVMFVLLGLPGLGLASLAWFTLREPRLREPAAVLAPSPGSAVLPRAVQSSAENPGVKQVCLTLWANRTFRHLLYSVSVFYFFGYGILQWQPSFFVRSFGLKTGELGFWFALVCGLGGILGTQLGGEWASRCAPDDERRQLRVIAIANAGFNAGVWSLIYFSHNYHVAFLLMGLATVGGSTIFGPLFATIQTLVQPRIRAMSIALVYLCANLVGMGLGPLAVGVLSDALQLRFGQESLRYALLATCPGYLWVSWHLWKASKSVTFDLAAARNERPLDPLPQALLPTL